MRFIINLFIFLIHLSLIVAQNIIVTITTTAKPSTSELYEQFRKPQKMSDLENDYSTDLFSRHLTSWLFTGCSNFRKFNDSGKCTKYRTAFEYPGYDGWYNNIARPELGAVDTPLLRRLPAVYEDGVYKPSGSDRPEPLEISEQLLSGKIGSKSKTGRNVLLVFFGQQVVEEILDTQRPACPPEYINIKIPKNHSYRNKPGHTEMPILRSRYDQRTGHSPNNPRQQLNEITPFLDGGLIYGTSKAWSNILRTDDNGIVQPDGQLASSYFDYPDYNTIGLPMTNPPPPIYHHQYISRHYTENVNRYFKLGNPRGNENPFLLTFGIVWFKWHNIIALNIKRSNPNWSSDKIYNEARKWVIATQQHIVVNEWLPSWLGFSLPKGKEFLPPYEGYKPNIDPQIDQFFQSAAFRFGHTLVPPGVYLRDYGKKNCSLDPYPIRICNNYWMPENSLHVNLKKIEDIINIEKLLMGMAIQLCEKEDHKIVEDLRGSLFGPLEFSRRDLMALNIQRARDHGVPDYNSARLAYGLPIVKNISHFKHVDVAIQEKFLKLYNNSFDNVDIWVGGILETIDGPGELFQKIISDQFQRIRDGDRFWYKNLDNGLFSSDETQRIEELSFYDILMSVTEMDWNDIPKNPFRVPMTKHDIHPSCFENNILVQGQCNEPCYHAEQIDEHKIENCTEPGTYDFFSNSSLSFILTLLGVSVFFSGFIMLIFLKIQFQDKETMKEDIRKIDYSDTDIIHTASEWQEPKAPLRRILLVPNARKNQLEIKNQLGYLMRAIDFSSSSKIMIYCASDKHYMLIRVHHSYDLVLKFDSDFLRSTFIKTFEKFISEISTNENICSIRMITYTALLKQAIIKKHRQKKLEMFFRVVFAQAFHIAYAENEVFHTDSTVAREVIYTELTIIEFAEALSMRPDSEFVKKIFNLVDKDKNGFISFREFVDMLVIFLKGSAKEKMKLMFDMYAINNTQKLKREDFSNMLRSFMETSNVDVTDNELETLVQSMMSHANLANKETIDFPEFQQILSDFNDKFNYAELEFNVPKDEKSSRKLHAGVKMAKSTFIGEVQKTIESLYVDPNELQTRIEGNNKIKNESVTKEKENNSDIIDNDKTIVEELKKNLDDYWYPVMKYLANKRLQIFWSCLYTLFLFGIFAERVYYYSIQREHTGLRRILGHGLPITRGAASAIMFTYSTLLIMMCHNTITVLRTTILQFYIPFDSAIEMHKYIACWALIFTVLHIIGHGFNFYHISIQTADDLTCLFRNYFHATHELPKFHYWCWNTMTGLTGILLTIVTGLIFVCSLSMVRKSFYNWFSFVHSLYPIFYILMILHGSGRLIQEPYFHYFFLGPAILFILDKIITVTRTTIEIRILKAEILPSGVTCIIFPKPLNFQYKSGQWIRIACPVLQTNEYHPFTLSSAPHETSLSIHIRAVGPWTTNIREQLELCTISNKNLPVIHIDGPYGEGHQDWDKYEVAIMIGGGIGVTPFASILKDIVFKSNCKLNFNCKKIYFLWVTRTQKQFEWMVDILRELEKADVNNIVSIHIFITQFYHKFDLRTILLYICERHFQKISNKSLFTGLKAVTHFGRPKFFEFFLCIQKLHPTINKIGIFSCGTPAMTRAVDTACKAMNLTENNNTLFQHHYKSF